jgi:hypothetical protein
LTGLARSIESGGRADGWNRLNFLSSVLDSLFQVPADSLNVGGDKT